MDKGVIIEDASPDEVFSSNNERTREFLGKYHDVNQKRQQLLEGRKNDG